MQARQWACQGCGAARDAAAVEALLIAELRAQARAFQLQDLRCDKCRQVRRNSALEIPLETECLGAGAWHSAVADQPPARWGCN